MIHKSLNVIMVVMKKVLLIGTGGTISSVNKGNGLEPTFNAEDILAYCPSLKELCEIETKQLFALDSTNIRPGHWLKIAEAIQNNYDKYDGFVILHGTDTMAYTAAAINYLVQNSPKPIVFTGSQKPIDEPTTDAVKNIIDAFTVACDNECFGVQLVFFGSIIAASRARKNFSKSYFAFGSINYPELGHIYDNKVIKYIKDEKPDKPEFYDYLNPNVGLIKFTPGMRNDVLKYIIDQYDGLVIETFGVGGLPEYSDFYNQISRAISLGKIVVMTTQVPNEGSNLSVYKVGSYLKNNFNILEAHDMTSESALCKLMWVLAQTLDYKEAEPLFYKTIGYDIVYK